jgi:hypothetical protein
MGSSVRIRATSRAAIIVLLFLIASASVFAQYASGSGQAAPQGQMTGPQTMAPSQISIAGSIAAINGDTIFLKGDDGKASTVVIQRDTLIFARKAAALGDILAGDSIGVAATQGQDGSLTATAINIFPPELVKRIRIGQFPMANGQVMTNGQVDRFDGKVEGRVVYMRYEMLTAAIAVPDNAEIHKSVKASLADLKVGLKVMVREIAGADGRDTASFITFDLPVS